MTSASLRVRAFAPEDADAVVDLWRRCDLLRPWNDPRRDIARRLAVGGDGFLVGECQSREYDGRQIVAVVMAGYDGHRGWLNYLAVDPDRRGEGFGREIVRAAEVRLEALGCPKVNLQVRTGNAAAVGFYERIGYSLDDVVSMGRRLIADD